MLADEIKVFIKKTFIRPNYKVKKRPTNSDIQRKKNIQNIINLVWRHLFRPKKVLESHPIKTFCIVKIEPDTKLDQFWLIPSLFSGSDRLKNQYVSIYQKFVYYSRQIFRGF